MHHINQIHCKWFSDMGRESEAVKQRLQHDERGIDFLKQNVSEEEASGGVSMLSSMCDLSRSMTGMVQ
jgi:hypothetical protein